MEAFLIQSLLGCFTLVNIGYDVYSPPYFIMELKEGFILIQGGNA